MSKKVFQAYQRLAGKAASVVGGRQSDDTRPMSDTPPLKWVDLRISMPSLMIPDEVKRFSYS